MKKYFSKSLNHHNHHLLFQAHSHHLWPDIAFNAMEKYQVLVQEKLDDKWEYIFENHIPRAQKCAAKLLNWPFEKNITFGESTFEMLTRLLSSLLIKNKYTHILTTDFEYHSARRLFQNIHNHNLCEITAINVNYPEILTSLDEKLAQGKFTCCFLSQSFYLSGYTLLERDLLILAKKYPEVYFIFDCYHSFAARPLDFATTLNNVALLAGGYKYAMSGEGCCFLAIHPQAPLPEPMLNGWMAEFSMLSQKPTGIAEPPITTSGFYKFMGATFDPIGVNRFFEVWEFLSKENISTIKIKSHAELMQQKFKEVLDPQLLPGCLIYNKDNQGNFISLQFKNAKLAQQFLQRLNTQGVKADARDKVLRLGFGPYVDSQDVLELACQLNPLKEELLLALELNS